MSTFLLFAQHAAWRENPHSMDQDLWFTLPLGFAFVVCIAIAFMAMAYGARDEQPPADPTDQPDRPPSRSH